MHLAQNSLAALGPAETLATLRWHLTSRPDMTPEALHAFANQLSRYADAIERLERREG
ncbi:hypothetical protein [Maritimibacter sp. DP1N21-5]|uniref:hypothetical protein n=1 Tax=Maritimibacter sp. DP1N21-5 TaxID=2836867 RepID=UPI001C465D56|nr:hypothetical protein [Maritimibacter sp. DP1N21-5]